MTDSSNKTNTTVDGGNPIKDQCEMPLGMVPPHATSDIPLYKATIWFLGLAVLLAIIGAVVLAAFGKTVPETVVAIGSASVGALAGVLAPSPSAK